MNKSIIITIVLVILAGAGGFFAGTKYQQGKRLQGFPDRFSQGQRGGLGQRQGNGANMVRGEIIKKENKSLTVKLPDDSTKIILVNDKTVFSKTQEGEMSDLKQGDTVMVFGATNTDGSLTGQNIQINPRENKNSNQLLKR